MRRRNLSLVLHAVAAHGPLSRASVAARVGLTPAARSTQLAEQIPDGLRGQQGPPPPRTGRPPRTAQQRQKPPA
ncbi:ROK family protein, partial [Streptomyces hygroscopicus]